MARAKGGGVHVWQCVQLPRQLSEVGFGAFLEHTAWPNLLLCLSLSKVSCAWYAVPCHATDGPLCDLGFAPATGERLDTTTSIW